MDDVALLLDKAKKTLNANSDAELARQLGVTRASVSNWRTGRNLPDVVQCATLAGLTGEPLAKVLGIVGEARAISREEKSVWRKLAASAMAAFVLLGATTLPGIGARDAHAQDGDAFRVERRVLPIMSSNITPMHRFQPASRIHRSPRRTQAAPHVHGPRAVPSGLPARRQPGADGCLRGP